MLAPLLEVFSDPDDPARGTISWPGGQAHCALGPSGIHRCKQEGDGVTPAGLFPLRRLLYRADRGPQPQTSLPVSAIQPDDGWCDASNDPAYNTQVRLPFAASHEKLWRDDELYDLVVVIGHNDDPVIAGDGSAIFVHIAREGYTPTHGCVALARADLETMLTACSRQTLLRIQAPDEL